MSKPKLSDIKKVLNKGNSTQNEGKNNHKDSAKMPKRDSKTGIIIRGVNSSQKWYKNPTLWILAVIAASIVIFRLMSPQGTNDKVDYGVLIQSIKDNKVESVNVSDYAADAKKKDSNSTISSGIPGKAAFTQSLKDAGIDITDTSKYPAIQYSEPAPVDLLPLVVNFIIIIGGILLMVYLFSRQSPGGGGASGIFGMGESKARMIYGKKQDINFDSVAGADESKQELQEIVDFLKNPQKYTRIGARIPKGVLLVGPPGTGKTLLARAVSGEAGVPFFFTSGAEFEELLVGAGAARVRDLFAKAKKASPSIIFIDEIDAMARKRGSVIQSTATEQTLNQILVEMDGFDNNTGIIILAATNRPDVLDPAILRPGRFDRRVMLDLPDKDDRKQIIAVHSKNKPLSKEIDMDVIARRTGGFSGADIENMLNESAINTARAGRNEITYKDIEDAVAKIMVGPAKKTMATDKDRKIIAYHEAGHAIVGYVTGVNSDVHRITIIARGSAGGYTEYIPTDDDKLVSREKMLSMITSAVAGNATEKMIFQDITSGASDDFEKATSIARRMVMKYGMGDIGQMSLSMGDDDAYSMDYGMRKEYSEKIAEKVDDNVQRILTECYAKASKILEENKAKLERVVQVLFEKETIEGDEFKVIMAE